VTAHTATAAPVLVAPLDQAARERIRFAHDHTLFVEAGAGTGKTAALVARVVELIATGTLPGLDRLAAITFTENAAAELRDRVRAGLERVAGVGADLDREYDLGERERCRAALRRFDDATITTLHGFAAGVLQLYPLEAGLPPGFTVRDAIQARLASLEAWSGFLDLLLADERVEAHLLAALTLGMSPSRLREIAEGFSGSWDLLAHRPFQACPMPPIDATEILRPLAQAAGFADRGPDGDRLTTWLRDYARPHAEDLASLTDPVDIVDAIAQLTVVKKAGNKKAWERVGLSKDQVAGLLAECDAARQTLLDEVARAVTQTLCARLQDHVLERAAERQQAGELEFHDLLVLTRNLLRDDPEVRTTLHHQYPVILIDEFQDTDPLQVEIACLIAAEPVWPGPGGVVSAGPGPAGVVSDRWQDLAGRVPAGRLFFVGDPKQSIYRFRRADVGTYLKAGRRFSPAPTRLAVNFRSVPQVIRAVNTVFDQLMAAADASVPDQIGYVPLTAHRSDPDHPAVRLLGGPCDGRAEDLRDREARQIAATIRDAKADRWPVHDDRGQGDVLGWRPASYQDMAILLPTRRPLPALAAALEALDIPYRIESRSLVWATDTVRDLITLLQAVDDPTDEVAIVSALRHPGLACSDVDLATWRAAGGGWDYRESAPVYVAPDHPVAAGMATLARYHEVRLLLPANDLVDRIIRELRLVELTTPHRRPRDHWRRLRFLCDQARACCDAGRSDLGSFVTWARDQINADADAVETVVPEPDDDAVRILTIHAAKGLEFPITILAGLGSNGRIPSNLLWNDGVPQVRLNAALTTPEFTAQASVDQGADRTEALRLLYVAMTRARDHLVVGCYHKPSRGTPTHAQRVWDILSTRPDLVTVHPGQTSESPQTPENLQTPASGQTPEERGEGPAVVPSPPPPAPVPRVDMAASDREQFLADRATLLDRVREQVATSPSALAALTHPTPALAPPDAPRLRPGRPDPANTVWAGEGPRLGGTPNHGTARPRPRHPRGDHHPSSAGSRRTPGRRPSRRNRSPGARHSADGGPRRGGDDRTVLAGDLRGRTARTPVRRGLRRPAGRNRLR
jgi:ATP-dependent helicase/nuclease subunit A